MTRTEQKSSANTRSHQSLMHRVAEPVTDDDLSDCKFAGTRIRTSDAVHVDVCARTCVVPRGGDVCFAIVVLRCLASGAPPVFLGRTARNGPKESIETIIFTIGATLLASWRAPSFESILREKGCEARVNFWEEQLEVDSTGGSTGGPIRP